MNNSETTENQSSIKFDHLGQLVDLIRFVLALESRLSTIKLEDNRQGRKFQVMVGWLMWFVRTFRIPENHEVELTDENGHPMLNDINTFNFLFKPEHLQREFAYDPSRFTNNDGFFNLMGEAIDTNSQGFQRIFNELDVFPPRLVRTLMDKVKDIVTSMLEKPPLGPEFKEDFFWWMRFIQEQYARILIKISKQTPELRLRHNEVLAMRLTSRSQIASLIEDIPALILTARVVYNKSAEVINKELVEAFLASVRYHGEGFSETTKEAIKLLSERTALKHSRGTKVGAYSFLLSLIDCFDPEDKTSEPKHRAFIANTNPVEDRKRKQPP